MTRTATTPFVSYEWQVGGKTAASDVPKLMLTGVLSGNPIELTVVASDGKAESSPYVATTRVHNAPPKIHKIDIEPASDLVAGQPVVLRTDARDADGDEIDLDITWKVNGRRIAEDGPSFDTRDLARGDRVQAIVVASDGEDDSEPFETPEMTVGNTPPTITSWPGAPGDDGVFVYQIEAEDPDGRTRLLYELETGPEGMTVDAASGVVRWTPSQAQIGTFDVALIVDDQNGGKTKQVFELSTGTETAPPAAGAE